MFLRLALLLTLSTGTTALLLAPLGTTALSLAPLGRRRWLRVPVVACAEGPVDLGGSGEATAPTLGQAQAQVDQIMAHPEGPALMQKVAANPSLMQAAMELAQEGDAAAAKYADNREVMDFVKKLQQIVQPGP